MIWVTDTNIFNLYAISVKCERHDVATVTNRYSYNFYSHRHFPPDQQERLSYFASDDGLCIRSQVLKASNTRMMMMMMPLCHNRIQVPVT